MTEFPIVLTMVYHAIICLSTSGRECMSVEHVNTKRERERERAFMICRQWRFWATGAFESTTTQLEAFS